MTQEFVKMILSKEGQQVVVKGGYFPIAKAVTDEDIKKITAIMTN